MSVTKTARYKVLERDGFACQYCGQCAPDVQLHVDHVIPVAAGGPDDPSNLVAACADCNGGKGASMPDAPLVRHISELAAAYAAGVPERNRRILDELDAERSYVANFETEWNRYVIDWDGESRRCPLPEDYRTSITRFGAMQIPWALLEYAVEVAMSKTITHDKRFAYMCGVVYNRVNQASGASAAFPNEPKLMTQAQADEHAREYAMKVLNHHLGSDQDF